MGTYKRIDPKTGEHAEHYTIEFIFKGRRVKQTSGTSDRKEAKRIEKQLKEQLRNELTKQQELGVSAGQTWGEAVKLWLQDKSEKRSLDRDKQVLSDATETFGEGKLLKDVPDLIPGYAREVAELTSKANANAHLRILRALLRQASLRWKWKGIDTAVAMLETRKFRAHAATAEEIAALLAKLPAHQRPMVRFALASGLRFSNVANLRTTLPPSSGGDWPYVSHTGGKWRVCVPAIASKSGGEFVIPLSDEAVEILKEQPKRADGYIFADHKDRAPIKRIWTAWNRARKEVGLPKFRFHDLRHTWATWQAQKRVPDRILQELGGWKTRAMVEHYTQHTNVDELRQWV